MTRFKNSWDPNGGKPSYRPTSAGVRLGDFADPRMRVDLMANAKKMSQNNEIYGYMVVFVSESERCPCASSRRLDSTP